MGLKLEEISDLWTEKKKYKAKRGSIKALGY